MKSESEIAQSCLTLGDPMDCSLPGFSVSMEFFRQEYWSGVPLLFPCEVLTNVNSLLRFKPFHLNYRQFVTFCLFGSYKLT